MENLLPLIVMLVVILSVIGKARSKKRSKRGAAPPAGGWRKTFRTLLTDLQRRFESPSAGGPSGAAEWARLLKGQLPSQSLPDPPPSFPETAAAGSVDPVPHPVPPRSVEAGQTVAPVVPPSAPAARQPPAPRDRRPTVQTDMLGRVELRQAVIWSEILGPPMAIRPPSGRHGG